MKCFSLFTILHSVRFDFLLIGLPPAPNRKFEALQAAVNALTAAGLKVSFTSHPRQDLCHQAGRHLKSAPNYASLRVFDAGASLPPSGWLGSLGQRLWRTSEAQCDDAW